MPNSEKAASSDDRIPSGSAGYMELKGAEKDGDCHKVAVADGISSKRGCCNYFAPKGEDVTQFRCGTCEFVKLGAEKVEENQMEPVAVKKGADGTFAEPLLFCRLVKVDQAKREVWGVVTCEDPDRDSEICDFETTVPFYQALVDEMQKASAVNPEGGVNIFPLRAMHGLVAAGKGIAIEFRKEAKEIYMGFKVVDDNEWNKVQENVYTGFSQGGRYVKRWKDGDYTRYTAKPGEVSLVDVPCLEAAHFDAVKALKVGGYDFIKEDGTTEFRKFAGNVTKEGALPTTPTEVSPVDLSNLCTCKCAQCAGNDHANCTAAQKCTFSEAGKTVKAKKISLLKQSKELAAQVTKKHQNYVSLVKTILEERINCRAFGCLGKGMYNVGEFACVVDHLGWLLMSIEIEEEFEGEGEETEKESAVITEVRSVLSSLLDALLSYTESQVEEAKEYIGT